MKAADLARIDELDNEILTLCTRINSATYELLVMIREFDERAMTTLPTSRTTPRRPGRRSRPMRS